MTDNCPHKKELHWHVKKCQAHNIFPCFTCMSILNPPRSYSETSEWKDAERKIIQEFATPKDKKGERE